MHEFSEKIADYHMIINVCDQRYICVWSAQRIWETNQLTVIRPHDNQCANYSVDAMYLICMAVARIVVVIVKEHFMEIWHQSQFNTLNQGQSISLLASHLPGSSHWLEAQRNLLLFKTHSLAMQHD